MGHRKKGEGSKLEDPQPRGLKLPGLCIIPVPVNNTVRMYILLGRGQVVFICFSKVVWDPETAKSHYSPDKGTQDPLGSTR